MKQKRGVGELLRVNIIIPLWPVLVLGVVIVTIVYLYLPDYRDSIKFVTVLVGGAAGIYSAYYIGAALRLNLDREKQKASFEILGLLNRPEFVEVRKFVDNKVEKHDTISEEEIFKMITEDIKLYNSVVIVLGILEDMSISIKTDYANEDTLYMSIAEIVKRNYRNLHGYIEQMRKIRHNQNYFVELEKLSNAWEAGKRLSDGSPLPKLGKTDP